MIRCNTCVTPRDRRVALASIPGAVTRSDDGRLIERRSFVALDERDEPRDVHDDAALFFPGR